MNFTISVCLFHRRFQVADRCRLVTIFAWASYIIINIASTFCMCFSSKFNFRADSPFSTLVFPSFRHLINSVLAKNFICMKWTRPMISLIFAHYPDSFYFCFLIFYFLHTTSSLHFYVRLTWTEIFCAKRNWVKNFLCSFFHFTAWNVYLNEVCMSCTQKFRSIYSEQQWLNEKKNYHAILFVQHEIYLFVW